MTIESIGENNISYHFERYIYDGRWTMPLKLEHFHCASHLSEQQMATVVIILNGLSVVIHMYNFEVDIKNNKKPHADNIVCKKKCINHPYRHLHILKKKPAEYGRKNVRRK